MSELTSPELEKESVKYNIHLEPGIHSFPGSDLLGVPREKEILKRFRAGDLTAHAWNPQVAKRMKQYSPLVLGLDSVPGTASNYSDWTWLPGSPQEMSGRDSMFLLGGDMLHQQFVDSETFNKLGWSKVTDYVKKSASEGVTNLLVASLSIAALKKFREPLSRRQFLLAAFGGGTAAMFLGKFSPIIQSYSPSSRSEGISQKVTNLTKPWFSKSKWLDGRTALIIAKTLEAMKLLNLPEDTHASIVMGYPHAYEADQLLTSFALKQ